LRALVRAAVGARVDGANDRTWPLVGSLAGKKVLVAGLGSVGSRISEDLVRSGVGEFVLVDPEQIEASNLARTVYAAADVGTAKVDALSRRLRAIDPAVRISGHPASLADVALEDLLEGVDLVIGATDHMPDQTVLSHHAYHAGVPMVACALYREAAAGEVVLSVPSASTACWACTVGEGSTSSQYRPGKDYGLGGRLVGEAALGPSIHLVANVATIAALGLLADPGNPVHERIVPLLDARRTLGLVSSVHNWEFFAQIFEGQSHQFAPQSVWAKVAGDPACPVCGPERMAPPTRATGVAFRALLQNLSGAEGAEREEGGPSGTEPSNAGLVDEYEADCGAGRYGDGPQGAKLPR
jgi:molybdopterin/thiamine biosynthesis adenylyltransferase